MTQRQPSGGTATRRRAATALAMVSLLGAVGIGRAEAQLVLPIGGQTTNVANSGGGQANTGGNSSTGNNSTNTATSTVNTQNPGGVLGSLVGVNLGLAAPTNTSTGTSNITTGPATAVGNQSATGVSQDSGGGTVNRFGGGGQVANVANEGGAVANTGGNTGVGNNSENRAINNVEASGGLINAAVNVGGPTNNSSGTSNITTGAATAVGNAADTAVDQSQAASGHGVAGQGLTFVPGVGFVPTAGLGGACGAGGGQRVNVVNSGEAVANTGNNTSVGNNSVNEAVNNQTISGGLVGLILNVGGPTNNSTGTSTIQTGPASAIGNQSTTVVDQDCVGFVPVAATRQRDSVQAVRHPVVKAGTLARTGAEAPDLALMAAALLFGGSMMVLPARRRRQQATAVEVAGSD